MRIGWVVYGGIEQATGGYTYDRCIIDGLRSGTTNLDGNPTTADEVEVISLPQPGGGSSVAWNAAWALAHVVRHGVFDVIVGDELCHRELALLFSAFGALSSLGVRVPLRALLVHHLTQWETNQVIPSEQRTVKHADVVFVTSHASARRLQAEMPAATRAVRPGRPHVCLPGADRLPIAPRVESSRDVLRLLFVGTWTARKGLLTLLRALAGLAEDAYELTIVGDSGRDLDYAAQVHHVLAQFPKVSERCRMRGIVPDAELSHIYARHDVLVLPSLFEGYGMVLSEAARAGLGVIASETDATLEVAPLAQQHVLIAPGDVLALRDAVLRLLQDRHSLRRSALSVDRMQSLPSWAATVAEFRAALSALISA